MTTPPVLNIHLSKISVDRITPKIIENANLAVRSAKNGYFSNGKRLKIGPVGPIPVFNTWGVVTCVEGLILMECAVIYRINGII